MTSEPRRGGGGAAAAFAGPGSWGAGRGWGRRGKAPAASSEGALEDTEPQGHVAAGSAAPTHSLWLLLRRLCPRLRCPSRRGSGVECPPRRRLRGTAPELEAERPSLLITLAAAKGLLGA